MALYEITFLTRDVADPGVRQVIEAAGGSIQSENSLGRRRLVYPIKKETQAVYTTYVFDTEPKAIGAIDRKLRPTAAVLRYLLVTKITPRPDKAVSKAVKEAIAAAEKLEDVTEEMKAETAPVASGISLAEPVPVSEPAAKIDIPQDATLPKSEKLEEKPAIKTPEEKAPAKKTQVTIRPRPRRERAFEPAADAATVTEEDRLKALEDKLGEILKD